MNALQLPTLAQSLDQTKALPKEMFPTPDSADLRSPASAVSPEDPFSLLVNAHVAISLVSVSMSVKLQ